MNIFKKKDKEDVNDVESTEVLSGKTNKTGTHFINYSRRKSRKKQFASRHY